jgi:hypothetical protein
MFYNSKYPLTVQKPEGYAPEGTAIRVVDIVYFLNHRQNGYKLA